MCIKYDAANAVYGTTIVSIHNSIISLPHHTTYVRIPAPFSTSITIPCSYRADFAIQNHKNVVFGRFTVGLMYLLIPTWGKSILSVQRNLFSGLTEFVLSLRLESVLVIDFLNKKIRNASFWTDPYKVFHRRPNQWLFGSQFGLKMYRWFT